jgi:hypothetical protein
VEPAILKKVERWPAVLVKGNNLTIAHRIVWQILKRLCKCVVSGGEILVVA